LVRPGKCAAAEEVERAEVVMAAAKPQTDCVV